MAPQAALPVILHPGVIALSFFEDPVRRLLRLWRDGGIRPQVTRPILTATLETLKECGLEDDTLGRWALWLTDPRSCDYHRLAAADLKGSLRELRGAVPAAELVSSVDAASRLVARI